MRAGLTHPISPRRQLGRYKENRRPSRWITPAEADAVSQFPSMSSPKHIPLSAIKFDSATQVRAELDAQAITDYAERMVAGDTFPPVELFQDGDDFYIGDGWHRLLAAQRNEDVTIRANVQAGGRREAIKFSLSANANHGMKRTNADKRRAVEIALKEFGNLSSAEVARICAVGDQLVSRVREELQPRDSRGSTEARMGADGKIRKMPVASMKHEPRGEPEESTTKNAEEKPPVGGSLKDIEEDAKRPGGQTRERFTMPPRGLFLARGALGELEKIQPKDSERKAALIMVRDWCISELKNTQ